MTSQSIAAGITGIVNSETARPVDISDHQETSGSPGDFLAIVTPKI